MIRAFYERLVKAGKRRKVALVACMRKLLTMLNTIVRTNTPWREPSCACASFSRQLLTPMFSCEAMNNL